MKKLILSLMIIFLTIIITFIIGIYIYFVHIVKAQEEDLREIKKERNLIAHIRSRRLAQHAQEKVKAGFDLFHHLGCSGCHAIFDDSILLGPSLKGITQKSKQYFRQALEEPNNSLVKGYEKNVMPSFNLSQEELDHLWEYMKLYP